MDWFHPVAPFGPHRYFDFRSFSPFRSPLALLTQYSILTPVVHWWVDERCS
jgi:hypothetical protein